MESNNLSTFAFLLLGLFFVSFANVEGQTLVPDVCQSGWTSNDGRCFIKIPVNQNWGQTESDCNGVLVGASLASLHSSSEINFVKNTLGCSSTSNICWIGLYQVQGQGNTLWQWKDGSSYLHAAYTSSSLWLSNEPNDVDYSTTSKADCGGIAGNGFLDLSCSASYKGVCVSPASCRAGYYKTSSYSVTQSPTSLTVSKGVCTLCPAGKYRTLTDPQSQCIDCDAGYMGNAGATSRTCTSQCPNGYYCSAGTATGSQIPCPAGKYGNGAGQTSINGCLACPSGKYCVSGGTSDTIQSCLAGYCGYSQASTPQCSQPCTPGYYCPTGSECPSVVGELRTKAAFECGGNNVYCQSGSQTPVPVPDGSYSIGGSSTTRTGIVDCERGYYCTGGVRQPCPAGKYGPSIRLTSQSGCLNCNAGYFCDLGSISPNNDHCAPTSAPTPTWTKYYCPTGAVTRQQVTGTDITTPTSAPTQNREGFTTCPQNSVCANGLAENKLSWGGSSPVCGSTISVDEKSPTNTLIANFDAVLSNLISNPGAYTTTYSILSFDYYLAGVNADCTPGSNPLKNGDGLFAINSGNGEIRLTRNTLNFEVCSPVTDIKYKAVIRATATDGATPSNLDCTIYIKVNDINDDPVFAAPTAYRMIEEKQLKNTPAVRCNANAVSNFGCDANEDSLDPQIVAIDEDYGSVMTYTFATPAAPGQNFFKINPCTGIISYAGDKEVSFSFSDPKPKFTFTVIATDDGNGKLFYS